MVQAVERLVQYHGLRAPDHRGGQAEPLAHAEREAADPLPAGLQEPGLVKHLVDPRPGDAGQAGLADAALTDEKCRRRLARLGGLSRGGEDSTSTPASDQWVAAHARAPVDDTGARAHDMVENHLNNLPGVLSGVGLLSLLVGSIARWP